MKKILLLRGNTREKGYTKYFTDLFVQGVRETDASLKDVTLPLRDIRACLGCYACWVSTPGRCVQRDDMDELLPEFQAADVLVCATPLYFYTMSSDMKRFFERTLPVTREGLVATPQGLLRNRIRDPEQWRKKTLITIVVGALRDLETFRGVNETFKLLADGMDMELGGQLTRPESHLISFLYCRPKAIKSVQSAFVTAGREAGTRGVLSPETEKLAALPIAPSQEAFRRYSEVFWSRAVESGPAGQDVQHVVSKVAADVRILMPEMARRFDPKVAARAKAAIQFDFPDRGLHYRLAVSGGRCELAAEESAAPDLRVTCPSEAWAGIFTGQLDVRQALAAKQIVLEGDRSLFAKLPRWFPTTAE